MTKQVNWYNRHLDEADESYLAHMVFTMKTAMRLCYAGVALVIHGVFPFLCVTTASRTLANVNAELQERKARCKARKAQPDP